MEYVVGQVSKTFSCPSVRRSVPPSLPFRAGGIFNSSRLWRGPLPGPTLLYLEGKKWFLGSYASSSQQCCQTWNIIKYYFYIESCAPSRIKMLSRLIHSHSFYSTVQIISIIGFPCFLLGRVWFFDHNARCG